MYKEDFLEVSISHKIYYATAGNKNGIPLLKIHGGPGGSCQTDFFNKIDLNKYFVIIYDQRGCGKSIPFGNIEENTTIDLVEDIDKLLNFLKVEKIVINASSWGSCLALLFAIKYPNKIIKLYLNSIFLATKNDNKWFYEDSKFLFPDVHEKYMNIIPKNVKNKSKFLFKKIQSRDKNIQKTITFNLLNFELNLMNANFIPKEFVKFEDIDENAINNSKIFLYYSYNNYFLEDDFILKNVDKIKNINMIIYHGRLDMDCPILNVYLLQKQLLNTKFNIINNENHCGQLQKQLLYKDINFD